MYHFTLSFLESFAILPNIYRTVSQCHASFAMGAVIHPFTFVDIPIRPSADPLSVTLVLQPFTIIDLPAGHFIAATPLYLALLVLTHILAAIFTRIYAISRTQSVGIFSNIHITVSKAIFPLTVLHIVAPLTYVLISVGIREGAFAITHIVLPIPVIAGTIKPKHAALTVLMVKIPLTIIVGAVIAPYINAIAMT